MQINKVINRIFYNLRQFIYLFLFVMIVFHMAEKRNIAYFFFKKIWTNEKKWLPLHTFCKSMSK